MQLNGSLRQGRGNDFFLGVGAKVLIDSASDCQILGGGAQAYPSHWDRKLGGGELPPSRAPACWPVSSVSTMGMEADVCIDLLYTPYCRLRQWYGRGGWGGGGGSRVSAPIDVGFWTLGLKLHGPSMDLPFSAYPPLLLKNRHIRPCTDLCPMRIINLFQVSSICNHTRKD